MKKRILPWLITPALVFSIACASGRPAVNDYPRPMRVVTDDLDRRITIPVKVERVVSLAPNLTESIFAAGAGDRLVGVTTFCDYPEEAKAITKVGDTMNPNMETIVALKPDVVFVSTASQIENFTSILDQNGIAVYITNPARLKDVFENLTQLAIIFDTQDFTQTVVDELRSRESEVRLKCETLPVTDDYEPTVKRIPVFVQISNEPLFTIGKASFVTEIVQNAGGFSVTRNIETAYPKLSKETALALQPEAIILSDSPDNEEPNDVFHNSPAVKNGRVYKINADLIARPGPRLVDALEQLARFLHPEKFPE